MALPPMERACVLLKDVFDYSLEEVAELAGSTVGGVKAALNRGRSKLKSRPEPPARPPAATAEVLRLYVERFNRRDWEGLRELIAADARLRVADRFAGRIEDSPYFGRYERLTIPVRMAVGEVDGEAAILAMQLEGDAWRPHSAIRLDVSGERVVRVVDYAHCPWVLAAAEVVSVSRVGSEA